MEHPPHRIREVFQRLEEIFDDRIISIHRNHEWPPRSPYLTLCEFFLWGHLKGKVLSARPPDNVQVLEQRIRHHTE